MNKIIKLSFTKAALAASLIFFAFLASAQTNTVLNQDGADDRTVFQWRSYDYPTGKDECVLSLYEGIPTTVYIISKSVEYYIKYNEQFWGKDWDRLPIPFSNQTKKFMDIGSLFGTIDEDKEGYYDVSIEDVGNDQWSVSILRTVSQVDDISNQEYTGSEIKPEPMVLVGSLNLTKGTDYEYSYADNTNVGTAKVTVTFKGDYASQFGSVEKTFEIYAKTLSSSNVADIVAQSYIGSALTPIVKCDGITLVKGTDYDITLPEGGCVNAGDYTVTITGKGNYAGTIEKTFTINPRVTTSGALTLTEYGNRTIAEIQGDFINTTSEDKPLEISKSRPVDKVIFKRSFTKGIPATIMLPFKFTANDNIGFFYTLKSVEYKNGEWTADLTQVTGELTANTPYIFKAKDKITEANYLTFNNVELNSTSKINDNIDANGDWTLHGVYQKTMLDGDGKFNYGFAGEKTEDGISVGDFIRAGDGVWADPMRCYLTYKDGELTTKAATVLPDRIRLVFPDEVEEEPSNTEIITPVTEITPESGVKVWSYNKLIVIESQPDTDYTIVDLSGRILKTGVTHSTREEVTLGHNAGIVIVNINGKAFKVNL